MQLFATWLSLGAVAWIILSQSEISGPLTLDLKAIFVAGLFLLANALLAGLRLKIIARRYGYRISLPTALRANASGAALAQIMITYLGHTSGRALVLRRAGVRDSETVEFGIVERLAGLASLGSAAIAAALYLFGGIGLGDETSWIAGCFYLLGIVLAGSAGLFVWRREVASFVRSGNAYAFSRALVVAALWSIAVHTATLAAFVSLISGFSDVSMSAQTAAAGVLIMFAASIPISFGGWGIRELSAVAVLGFLGLSGLQAVSVGVTVGVGSLLVQLAIWMTCSAATTSRVRVPIQTVGRRQGLTMIIAVPALISVLIAFQVHIPTQAATINVNLADPFALVGLTLFLAYWIEVKTLPVWSDRAINLMLAVTTAVIVFGALHFMLAWGYSAWGMRNRLLGWVVLLAYFSSGAILATVMGEQGRQLASRSFVLSIILISALEIIRSAIEPLGVGLPVEIFPPAGIGFSGNTNAQGLLLVAAIAATLIVQIKLQSRIVALTILFAALFLSNSRAAILAVATIAVIQMFADRRLFVSVAIACLFALPLVLAPELLDPGAGLPAKAIIEAYVFHGSSDMERLSSIWGGLELWRNSPIFGSGIGAYFEQTSAAGTPLVIHNVAVWLLAETGSIGFLLVSLLGVAMLRGLWLQAHDGSDVARAVLLFLVGAGVMSLAHDIFYQRVVWFLMGVGLARSAYAARAG